MESFGGLKKSADINSGWGVQVDGRQANFKIFKLQTQPGWQGNLFHQT